MARIVVLLLALIGVDVLADGWSGVMATTGGHSVTYKLEWKGSQISSEKASGWEVRNDLGYQVRVQRGWLVNRSIELIPCNPRLPALSRSHFDGLIGARPAFAGHSAIADPSALPQPTVEPLRAPQSQSIGPLYPGAQQYCQAHYLIARADKSSAGLPAEVDMVDQSLRVEGTFRRPGGAADEPFIVVTALANGKLFDLPRAAGAAAAFDSGHASATVVVTRNLDRLFDRVDFATMDAKRQGREMLQNLVRDTEVVIEVRQ